MLFWLILSIAMNAMKKLPISELHSPENCQKRSAMKAMKSIGHFIAPKNRRFLRYEAMNAMNPLKRGKGSFHSFPFPSFWGAPPINQGRG